MQYKLTTPCTAEDLAPLKAGDTVLLSGVVYTARDQAHKRMLEALDKGEKLPFDLEGSAIYYVGPTPERPGEVIGSVGCTSIAEFAIPAHLHFGVTKDGVPCDPETFLK